ncbi:MAG: hypothetical protein LBB61_06300 [Treponema sp.]|jgi:hypothetical protein|nr:hypothetical protein [Treponema sp.]
MIDFYHYICFLFFTTRFGAALINKSFVLRGESGRLLNGAKEPVEREIETG